MTTTRSPWTISETDYPRDADLTEQLRFCLNYAILAPSSHNTQPWRFVIGDGCVDVHADYSRSLEVIDPDRRTLMISCGAAVFFLQVALHRFGHRADIRWLPLGIDNTLLARIRVEDKHQPNIGDTTLIRAIPERRTNRQAFETKLPPSSLLDTLEAAAEEYNSWLHIIIDDTRKQQVAELIAEADRQQLADKAFRQELADWMRTSSDEGRDGIPGYSYGIPALLDFATPGLALAVRTFDMGDSVAADHQQLALGSPVLTVLGTMDDTPRAWLEAGMALAGVLLWATADGVSASYLNQPCEIAELRTQLATTLGRPGYPQLILRLGYGPAVEPTPRRGVEEVTNGLPDSSADRQSAP